MSQIFKSCKDLYYNEYSRDLSKNTSEIINEILRSSCKNRNFDTTLMLSKIDEHRLSHILSVFYLGLSIYKNQESIKKAIDGVSITFNKTCFYLESDKYRFAFIWMLIAIFHDAGYAFEEGNLSPDNIQDSQDFLNSEGVYTPPIYSYRLLKSYAKMKKCSRGKYDHGIFGGFRLYEDLIKKKKTNTDQEAIFPIDVYECAAWTICCHNIFFVKSENTNPCYSRCGLSPLISSEKIRCIKYDQYPFLFLLSLVDTLEPIKRFPSDKDILSRIKIAFLSDSIQVDISDLMKTGQNDTRKYENTLDELDYWLTDVVGKRQNLKTIYIK